MTVLCSLVSKLFALDAPDQMLHKEVLSRLVNEGGEIVAPGAFIIAAEALRPN